MNYKITTYVLFVLLVATYALNWKQLTHFSFMKENTLHSMHQMPDGTMMSTNQTMQNMDTMMMDMTARMKGKIGDQLDKVFLEDMIVHHQGAVDMAKLLKAGTKRPELQKMADDIVTVQTKEIDMMKEWLKDWFGQ